MDTPIIIKKKKVHGGHGHHGGSWKVAYADFVTAMMAFFMVMWIMGLSEDQKKEVAGYFRDPFGYLKTAPKSDSIITLAGVPASNPAQFVDSDHGKKSRDQSDLEKIEQKVKEQIESTPDLRQLQPYVEMTMTAEGLQIEFVEKKDTAFFALGSAEILPKARELMQNVVAPLLIKAKRRVIIEGHTDAKPYAGDDYTNIDLSSDRAKSVYRALKQAGTPSSLFRGVRGAGDSSLKDPTHPFSSENRRVTLLLPFRTDQPLYNDLPGNQMPSIKDSIGGEPPKVGPEPADVKAAKPYDPWR